MYLLHHETNRVSCDKSLIDQHGQSNDRPLSLSLSECPEEEVLRASVSSSRPLKRCLAVLVSVHNILLPPKSRDLLGCLRRVRVDFFGGGRGRHGQGKPQPPHGYSSTQERRARATSGPSASMPSDGSGGLMDLS